MNDPRAAHQIAILRTILDSLEMNLGMPGRSLEAARALSDAAVTMVALVAVIDDRRARGGE